MTAILRKKAAADYVGLSESTLDNKLKEGTFPRPMKLGKRAIGWRETTLRDWLDALSGVSE